MFSSIPSLEWIERRPETATYDLGSSALGREDSPDGVVPARLADLPDPRAGTTLRSQLAAVYGVDEGEVLVTAGGTHANFLATVTALALTEPTDDTAEQQVLVEKPGYQPLVATPKTLGARPERFLRPPEDDYLLDPNRVANATADDLSLVTVTNRHNPSGRLTDRRSLAAVARVAADAGGYLLVDEMYAPYVDAATNERAFGGVTAATLPNTVVTGSTTHFHGLGGLRIGWLVGPESFVRRAKTAATCLPVVAEPSRTLARRALHNEETLAADSRTLLRTNHELLADFVEGRDDLSGAVHDGCTFAFLTHETADGDEVAEGAWREGVLVVPGRFFDRSEAFRLSLGGVTKEMEAGLTAFGEILDSL